MKIRHTKTWMPKWVIPERKGWEALPIGTFAMGQEGWADFYYGEEVGAALENHEILKVEVLLMAHHTYYHDIRSRAKWIIGPRDGAKHQWIKVPPAVVRHWFDVTENFPHWGDYTFTTVRIRAASDWLENYGTVSRNLPLRVTYAEEI